MVPSAFEPPAVSEPPESGIIGVTGSAAVDGITEEVTEAPENQEADPPREEDEGEPVAGEEDLPGAGEPDTTEIIDVPVDQKFSFQSRRIIKVPCNGNAKPDLTGRCRAVW